MSRATVDHPAGVGLSTARLRRDIEEMIVALTVVEEWAERHAADIGPATSAGLGLVAIWPTEDDVEAYHRLVAALAEIVDLSDPDSITPPSDPSRSTAAKVGPLRVRVFAPAATCERVQVGTRTVEEPVYEYRCSEVAS